MGVSEQGLNGSGFGAMFEQMSSKAVSQGVWGDVCEISDRGVMIDDGPQKLASQWLFVV